LKEEKQTYAAELQSVLKATKHHIQLEHEILEKFLDRFH